MTPSWTDASVLVTGAAGFLGRRLCARLLSLGAHVTAVVRTAESSSGMVEVQRITVADVVDTERIREVFAETKPSHVFHLAALTAPSRDLTTLPRYIRANTEGTAAVLAAASEARPRKIVVLGTAEEFGPDPPVPTPDDAASHPATPYGISKALATQLCLALARSEALPVTVLRPFLLYGPHQPARFFIRQLLDATLENRTLDMTKGEQGRDFLHVDDAVEGIIAASNANALDGQVANLCTGEEHSLEEVTRVWGRITGRTDVGRLGALPYRLHEVFHFVGESRRMGEATGWTPRISLEAGLQALWDDARSGGKPAAP